MNAQFSAIFIIQNVLQTRSYTLSIICCAVTI